MGHESREYYEFGPFRIDSARNLLLRGDHPVPLTSKALETLLVLVRQSERTLSKEELMKALWPDSFVEEANLTQQISTVRKALGETPHDHHYIVTVPGQGYRFAEKVRIVPTEDASPSADLEPQPQLPAPDQASPLVEVGTPLTSLRAKRPWRWALALGSAALLIAGFFITRGLVYKPPVLGEADSVLVSDFVNTTGEPIFDGSLKQALTVKLAESPYFNLVPESKAREILPLLRRSKDDRIVPPLSREICQRVGAKVSVDGSIVSLRNEYLLQVTARDCLSGRIVSRQESTVTDQNRVLPALGRIVPAIRRKLGESMASIQKFDTPIEQATTSSLPALKAYTSGDEKRARGQEAESTPFYRIALDLDPNFAIAYARLAAVYRDISGDKIANEYLTEAFERRLHVSEKEKFYIAAHYYADATIETDKAIAIYKLWAQTYPHDWIPLNNIAIEYERLGQPQEMLEAARKAIQLNPNHALPYGTVVQAYRLTGHFAEAKAIADRAIAAKLDGFLLHFNLYMIAFAEGDQEAIERETEWFKGKPLESWNLNHRAWAAMSLGQVRMARELFHRAYRSALENGLHDYAVATANDEAQLEAELGYRSEARTSVELNRQTSPESLDTLVGGALALARCGEWRKAEALAQESKQQWPLNELLNKVMLPSIRAAIDLARKQPAQAVEELRPVNVYDLSSTGTIPELITVYYRGQALLELGSGQEAAAQFQKILDNRPISPISPYCSLARLGLARAYALAGDEEKSLTAYREFLALWKDADRDLSVLKQAKTEYGRLR